MGKYEEKYGFVAFLDVLGISTISSVEQSKSFLKRWDDLFNSAKNLVSSKATKKLFPVAGLSPVVFRIGDTIVCSWEIDRKALSEIEREVSSGKETGSPSQVQIARHHCRFASKYLPHIADWLSGMIFMGLEQGLLLRGALAIGDYVVGPTGDGSITLVGPAVSDAASWYEATDWFGVIFTPACGLLIVEAINGASCSDQNINLDQWFVEYPVPSKDREAMNLWSISWPCPYYQIDYSHGENSPLSLFNSLLLGMPIPKGTESKYFNSIKFFRWYGQEIYPKVKENMEELGMDGMNIEA